LQQGKGAKPDLLSFSMITDEPPAEVAAAGHDRCPVVLKESNVRAWLSAPGGSPAYYDGFLEDKERPLFSHHVAA
jgi:putative SOS response-associated peptidase YedK